MRVVMLSDAESGGGAAICASRLAVGLCKQGVEVTRLVRVANGGGSWKTKVFTPPTAPGLARRVRRRLGWIDEPAVRIVETNRQLEQELAALKPDVINIHNLHWDQGAGWTPMMAEVCLRQAPTVWTLHDMWSFTGRCAYSYDCRRFLTGCDASCPTPNQYPALEPRRIAGAWEARKHMLARCLELVAVTPSRWLAEEAKSGLWANHRVEVIPYGLPLETYKPLDRALARAALDIPASGRVVLVSGNKVTPSMIEVLRGPKCDHLTVLVLGRAKIPDLGPRVSVHDLGWVDHERTKVLAFNSADLYLHYIGMDNLPNIIMEALACGTPVVADRAGGVPDLVRPNVTGWLADESSVECVRIALDGAIVQIEQGVDLRDNCRAVAESEYGDDLQGSRYVSLFGEIVGANESIQETQAASRVL